MAFVITARPRWSYGSHNDTQTGPAGIRMGIDEVKTSAGGRRDGLNHWRRPSTASKAPGTSHVVRTRPAHKSRKGSVARAGQLCVGYDHDIGIEPAGTGVDGGKCCDSVWVVECPESAMHVAESGEGHSGRPGCTGLA